MASYEALNPKCSLDAVPFTMFVRKQVEMDFHSLAAAIHVGFETDFH